MKIVLRALTLAAAIALIPGGAVSAKEKVVIADMNWTGAIAIANVLKVIMEKYLDAEVEFTFADDTVVFAAMNKGDGSIDINPDFWSNHWTDLWDKFIAEGSRESVLVNDTPYLGEEGLWVPDYVYDDLGLRSVQDLANPDLAKQFDTDGDGLGDYWTGAVGWVTEHSFQVHAKSFGYTDYWQGFNVEQDVAEGLIDSLIKRRKPVLFYHWKPEWIHIAHTLKKLEEPAFDGYANPGKQSHPWYKPDGCYNFVDPDEDSNWLDNGYINCGMPSASVYIAYATALAERSPKIGQFLKQVALDSSMVSGWLYAMGKEGREAAEVAEEWVAANPDIVEGKWLAGIDG